MRNLYDILTDKLLTRRILAIVTIMMVWKTLNTLLEQSDKWDSLNEWTASIFIAFMGFCVLVYKYYFKAN